MTTQNGVKATKGASGDPKVFDRRMLMVVFVTLLIDLLAFTLILPLLPALLDYYGQHEEDSLYASIKSIATGFRELVGAPDTAKWNSVLFGGLIGSMFSLLQFLSSPLIGAASDVYGRRPLMLLCLCGILTSYVIWFFSRNFTLFVLARFIGGISKGNVSLSTAVVTDITPQEKRSTGMAFIGIAFSLGFLIGPMIGAYFSSQARTATGDVTFFAAPALCAIALATTDLTFFVMFFKETLPQDKRAKSVGSNLSQAMHLINPKSLFNFTAVKASKKDLSSMQRIGLVYFLYLFLYSGLEFTLTFLTYTKFNFTSMQQGKMFFVIGLVMVLVQGGYVRRIKPGKEIQNAIVGFAITVPSFLVIGFANEISTLYFGLILYALATALVVPCLTSAISSYGTVDQKGTVLGIFRSLGALARGGGPMFASSIYWSFGVKVCYTFGGVALLIPLLIIIKSKLSTKQA